MHGEKAATTGSLGHQEMLDNSAYYYIDDVRIEQAFLNTPEATTLSDEGITKSDKEFVLNSPFSFKTVQFEFNSHVLVWAIASVVENSDAKRIIDFFIDGLVVLLCNNNTKLSH